MRNRCEWWFRLEFAIKQWVFCAGSRYQVSISILEIRPARASYIGKLGYTFSDKPSRARTEPRERGRKAEDQTPNVFRNEKRKGIFQRATESDVQHRGNGITPPLPTFPTATGLYFDDAFKNLNSNELETRCCDLIARRRRVPSSMWIGLGGYLLCMTRNY